MMKHIWHLSRHIGERHAGTNDEAEAADYIKEELSNIGLAVRSRSFHFLGWELKRPPTLEVLRPEVKALEAEPAIFSSPTPKGGVTGELKPSGSMHLVDLNPALVWPRYSVVDDKGEPLAHIISSSTRAPITFPLTKRIICGGLPTVIVGMEGREQIEALSRRGTMETRVELDAELRPDSKSQNIHGLLKGSGESDERIVVCAHYDSMYGSPGANDNASGIEAMLRIAEGLAGKRLETTIEFIAFGAEEYGLFGSRTYVDELKDMSEVSKVKATINLDTVAAGERLLVWAGPESFIPTVSEGVSNSALRDYFDPKDIRNPGAGFTDSMPFYDQGVPAVWFQFKPYDHWHRNTDTYEECSEEKLTKIVDAVNRLILTIT